MVLEDQSIDFHSFLYHVILQNICILLKMAGLRGKPAAEYLVLNILMIQKLCFKALNSTLSQIGSPSVELCSVFSVFCCSLFVEIENVKLKWFGIFCES
jgi:hypothetical protein